MAGAFFSCSRIKMRVFAVMVLLLGAASLCLAGTSSKEQGPWAVCSVREPLMPAAGELAAYLAEHENLVTSYGIYGVSMTTVLYRVRSAAPELALHRLQKVGYCDDWTLIPGDMASSSLLIATAIQRESAQPQVLLGAVTVRSGMASASVLADGSMARASSLVYASEEVYIFQCSEIDVEEFAALELRGSSAIASACGAHCSLSIQQVATRAAALAWQAPKLQKPAHAVSPPVDLRALLQEFLEERRSAEWSAAADPIAERVALVSQDKLRSFLNTLTSVYTRLSDAGDVPLQASYFIKGYLQGLGLEPFFYYFQDGYVPDVCADITGALQPEVLVVVGAHMDDRAANINDPTARAPGANDDGSGSAMLSELVRIFAETKTVFEYTVRFCWWAGEEQGLLGSTAYADELYNNGTEIVGMLQGDMLAYRVPGAPTQVDMATRSTDYDLTMLMNEVTGHYVPEILIGNTTSCCTDSASFYNVGYAAAAYNEAGGYTIDPE